MVKSWWELLNGMSKLKMQHICAVFDTSNDQMESFPGAFPGLYQGATSADSRQPRTGQRARSTQSTQSIQSNLSPELIHVQKSWTLKKRLFTQDLVFQLDCLTYAYFCITYLYDCSLLLLLLKILVQSSILIVHWFPVLESVVARDALASSKRTTLHGIVLVNAFSVLLHIARDLPIPSADGYIYGHHTLQVVGQHELQNKYWLLAFDAVCFVLQILVFGTQSHTRRQEGNILRCNLLEEEYDGAQGTTVALKIDFVEALKPPFATVSELRAGEVRRQSREEILDALMNNQGHQRGYGSLAQADTGAVPASD